MFYLKGYTKKIFSILLILTCVTSITSCYDNGSIYLDHHYTSFEEYKDVYDFYTGGTGKSVCAIDNAGYWLPSLTFFDDYEFVEATYSLYEEDPLRDLFDHRRKPDVAILTLTYEEGTYNQAKSFMLSEIELLDNKIYTYNDFCFYVNYNYYFLYKGIQFGEIEGITDAFMMACYNDQKNILAFVGYYQGNPLSEEEVKSIEEDWASFVEEHFNPYYDFSK